METGIICIWGAAVVNAILDHQTAQYVKHRDHQEYFTGHYYQRGDQLSHCLYQLRFLQREK